MNIIYLEGKENYWYMSSLFGKIPEIITVAFQLTFRQNFLHRVLNREKGCGN